MLALLRHVTRGLTALRALARHGALFPLERLGMPSWFAGAVSLLLMTRPSRAARSRPPGERLVLAMTALGPAFVKIGQGLSVRPDLVGQEFADSLSVLRSSMPPFGGELAVAAIEAEFGRPLDELFSSFEHEAFAAASIAQVHKATTPDGNLVAVKILRPEVEKAFARDLKLAIWAAGVLERHVPELRRLRPRASMETIARATTLELDLRFEGAAADELHGNFDGDSCFRVPAVDWRRTGRRVLTLNWVDAVAIDRIKVASDLDISPDDIVVNLARIFFLQVFRDGFFHADLHPGNLFVDRQGVVHAVDFGIMGRLDRPTRYYLAEMLHGFLTRDYPRVARAHRMAGYVPRHFSEEEFAQAARSIGEPIMGLPLREISLAQLLAQLFAITDRFEMPIQPQLLLLQKTMLVAEGVGRSLCPDANMWEMARPMIEDWMAKASDPETRARETSGRIRDMLLDLHNRMAACDDPTGLLAISQQPTEAAPLPSTGQGGRGCFWQLLTVALLILILALVVSG